MAGKRTLSKKLSEPQDAKQLKLTSKEGTLTLSRPTHFKAAAERLSTTVRSSTEGLRPPQEFQQDPTTTLPLGTSSAGRAAKDTVADGHGKTHNATTKHISHEPQASAGDDPAELRRREVCFASHTLSFSFVNFAVMRSCHNC